MHFQPREWLVILPLLIAMGCDTVRVRPAVDEVATEDSPADPTVDAGPAAISLAVGPHTQCAALEDGTLWCWGSSQFGLLGGARGPGPVQITDADAVTHVWVGERRVCYLGEAGLRCHGAHERGAIRHTGASLPQELGDATQVALGSEHLCGITAAGEVRCLGNNDHSECGESVRGRYQTTRSPGAVTVDSASAIAVGRHHSCAISQGLMCWGAATLGRLATDRIRYHTARAQPIDGIANPRAVAANPMGALTCTLSEESNIACWGATGLTARDGWLVAQTPKRLPSAEERVVSLAVGVAEVYAVTETGNLMLYAPSEALRRASARPRELGWRQNAPQPELILPEQPFDEPRRLPIDDVVEVGAGTTTTCARTQAGSVYCFGAGSREPMRVEFRAASAPEGQSDE